MDRLTKTSDVVEALGGDEVVAKLLNATPRSVRHWRSSNEFPPKTYLAITTALARGGKSVSDALWPFVPLNEGVMQPATGAQKQTSAAVAAALRVEAAE